MDQTKPYPLRPRAYSDGEVVKARRVPNPFVRAISYELLQPFQVLQTEAVSDILHLEEYNEEGEGVANSSSEDDIDYKTNSSSFEIQSLAQGSDHEGIELLDSASQRGMIAERHAKILRSVRHIQRGTGPYNFDMTTIREEKRAVNSKVTSWMGECCALGCAGYLAVREFIREQIYPPWEPASKFKGASWEGDFGESPGIDGKKYKT